VQKSGRGVQKKQPITANPNGGNGEKDKKKKKNF